MQTYEPMAGTSIDSACAQAVQIATELSDEVGFTFNGVALRARPNQAPGMLVSRWRTIQDEQRRAYEASPEGRQAKADRAATVARRQQELDSLIEALPKILRVDNHLDALMKWIKELIPNADDVDVKWNPAMVADTLEAAGYRNNAYVGHEPEWFDNRAVMGAYIVGQAINCMKSGMPPHPVATKFIDQYFAMPSNSEGSSQEETNL